MSSWRWFHQLGSPKWFYQKSAKWLPWLWAITTMLLAFGLYYSLYASPVDYQQGNSVRIMYIHVPAAALSMVGYLSMAVCAVIGLVWKMKMSFMAMRAIAPIGALFTLITLFTGSLWGLPTWGTWWEWDARMTSELVLLFLYLGFIALHSSFSDRNKADRSAAILAIVGAINVPIIYGSVKWWNTLHQAYSVTKKGAIAPEMQTPLFIMIGAFYLLFAIMVIVRLRLEIINREAKSKWLQAEITL
ncbi:heme ABC transporter permease [Kangiella sp. HZ709]|nr:heme ABC transporter permease [Kangiella sp. HZ709]